MVRAWRPVVLASLAWLASSASVQAQIVSSHPDHGGQCTACHPCGGVTSLNAPVCGACHDGDGTVLGGATPPVATGWSDPGGLGDAHGAAGTVAPLDCAACHAAHTSPNAFVLAPDASGTISREGVGAQRLCQRCHASRHAGCATECHTFHASDPIADGAPCFQCHGHDFTKRTFFADGTDQPWYCLHCHRQGFHASTAPPPAIADLRVVTGYDRARVVWRTTSTARAQVEWGTAEPTRTTANRWYGTDHAVSLPGLAEGVSYTFRARVNDVRREVVRSTLGTLTPGVASIPRPTHVGAEFLSPTSPATAGFGWDEETEPAGLPVTFQWELSSSPTFVPLVAAGETTAPAVQMPLPLGRSYYYRARARFTDRAAWSAWSASGSFRTTWCWDC